MEIDRLKVRRRSLAYLLAIVAGVPFLGSLGKIVGSGRFDVSEHFKSYTSSQLRKMDLSDEEVDLVAKFQKDVLAHSFGDFEGLRNWLVDKIDMEYSRQRLAVHKRCIVSHTELALLISNFPRGAV